MFSGLGIGALWKSLSWTFNIFRQEIGHSLRTSQFPERHAQRRHLSGIYGRWLRDWPADRGHHGRRRRACRGWVALPLLSLLGAAITTPFPPIHPNFANNPATGQPFLLSEMAPAKSGAHTRYIGAAPFSPPD